MLPLLDRRDLLDLCHGPYLEGHRDLLEPFFVVFCRISPSVGIGWAGTVNGLTRNERRQSLSCHIFAEESSMAVKFGGRKKVWWGTATQHRKIVIDKKPCRHDAGVALGGRPRGTGTQVPTVYQNGLVFD